jgi:predicted nucleic acid-binding protein
LPETNWPLLGQPFRDGLIASTALVHGMNVVTRNLADSEGTGVAMINPWITPSTLVKV